MLSIFDCEIPSNVSRAFSSDEIKGVIGVVLLIATRIATALPSSLNVFQFPRTCYFFFFLREANEYSAFFRHVVLVHSPTIYYNWYGGVVDAIYRARKGLVTKEEVKKQISIVAYGINSAAQILKLSPIEWTILSSPRKVSQLEDLVM